MSRVPVEVRAERAFRRATGLPWEWQFTGGGCTALILELTPNHYLMVTHAEDASVPEAAEPHCVGEYVDDEAVNYWTFPNRREAAVFVVCWIFWRGVAS